MRKLGTVVLGFVLGGSGAIASAAAPEPQQARTMDQVIDRVVTNENRLNQQIRQYSPLVETYIQNLKPDKELGSVPAGDKYFLGRADFSKGVALVPLSETSGKGKKIIGSIGNFFSFAMQFLPDGFLQMIYLDTNGFDKQHYKFDYVRREFLGEVRTLVFDVTPLAKSGKGRFLGRIWVEDQDFHIVRFNGAYSGSAHTNYYFHFDSWRTNVRPEPVAAGVHLQRRVGPELCPVQAALLQGADAAVGIQPRPLRAGAGTQQDPGRKRRSRIRPQPRTI